MNFLPSSNREAPPVQPTSDPADRLEPSLDTLVPDDPNESYDIKELILKVVDDWEFLELRPDYAHNIVTGFARMDGRPVGSSPTSRSCSPAASTYVRPSREPASCASATPSASRS